MIISNRIQLSKNENKNLWELKDLEYYSTFPDFYRLKDAIEFSIDICNENTNNPFLLL